MRVSPITVRRRSARRLCLVVLALTSLLAAHVMICTTPARAAEGSSPPPNVTVVSGEHGQDRGHCGDSEHGPADSHCAASSRDLATVVPAIVDADVVATADAPLVQARRPHSPLCSRPAFPPSGREVLVYSCVSRT